MKKTILFLTIFILYSNFIEGQNIKIKEPEFIGSIIFISDSTNVLTLTPQEGVVKTDRGFSKNSGYYFINGCCSSIQINKKNNLFFIAKFSENSIDPFSIIIINHLTQDKNIRLIGSFSKGETKELRISFLCKKYGNSSYLIEIPSIEVGEYAISTGKSYYSFSIK